MSCMVCNRVLYDTQSTPHNDFGCFGVDLTTAAITALHNFGLVSMPFENSLSDECHATALVIIRYHDSLIILEWKKLQPYRL